MLLPTRHMEVTMPAPSPSAIIDTRSTDPKRHIVTYHVTDSSLMSLYAHILSGTAPNQTVTPVTVITGQTAFNVSSTIF